MNESMNLRERISNLQKENGNLKSEDRLKYKVVKVLSVVWNTVTDNIQILTKRINSMKPAATKREVLAATKSTFNPLDYLTPSIYHSDENSFLRAFRKM